MTTTPNPTAERIVEHALREADMPWLAETPGDIVAALRAAGLLVGDPTEEQVDRAARALCAEEQNTPWERFHKIVQDQYRATARIALAGAGVAPQATPAEERIERAHAINGVREMEQAVVTSEWGTVVRKLDVIEMLRDLPAAGVAPQESSRETPDAD